MKYTTLQNSIIKEGQEEKLLREQFDKFERCKPFQNLVQKGSYNARYPSTVRRRSFHRLEYKKKSTNDIVSLPCLLYHRHSDRTFPNFKLSHVCKVKSNSMPRSVVERRKWRKRSKMYKQLENRLKDILHPPCNSQMLSNSENIPLGDSTPITTISAAQSIIVPKRTNQKLVYL